MAVVVLNGNRKEQVKHEIGLAIWAILNGEAEPDDEKQLNYCNQVVDVYLDWRNAPDSYIKHCFEAVVDMALGSWMCNERGEVTLPEPYDQWSIDFANKWGLLYKGMATQIVRDYNHKKAFKH